MQNLIGITSTVPIELIYAADFSPIDLNNEFISAPNPLEWIEEAEMQGFPRNFCAWIKGIFIAAKRRNLKRIVAVTQGDCSNTHVLMELLESQGIETIPFAYPYPRNLNSLRCELEKFACLLGTDIEAGLKVKKKFETIREKITLIDRITWEEGTVSGWENHLIQVTASDMKGKPEAYEAELDNFISSLPQRKPFKDGIRIGCMGVPTILSDLYSFLESIHCNIVYNETQRQFAMPSKTKTLEEQYFNFTYPYGIRIRLSDINRQITKRKISGMIHYVQSFCFRQLEEIIVKQKISVPVLLLEADTPGSLDGRSKTRIESFIEMLRNQ